MRFVGRLVQLLAGLCLFGIGIWLGLQAHLGVGPWDVLHGGLAKHLGTPFGRTSIGVSLVVFVIALAARVRPGIGTVANVVVIGLVIDAMLARPWLDGVQHDALAVRLLTTASGIASVALGSALYLGAHLGPGPRDGLMVAIHQRTGWPVGASRAALECSVLVLGVLLGGPLGVGTLAFALGIGPAVGLAFRLTRQTPVRRTVEVPL
jgi:uncharacterized membrane protein YczE